MKSRKLDNAVRVASRAALLAGAAAVFGSAPLHAQAVRSGGDNARAMQQMQQLASERTALQADNAKLKEQLEELKKKLDKTTTEHGAMAARAKTLEAEASRGTESSKQLTESLEKSRAQMQELITHFRETAQNLKTVEAERSDLRGQLDTRTREFKTCVDHNVDLYEINRETLGRLEKRGFWSGVRSAEPFTQLSRARLENLIDDYRYRIDELRIERQKKAAAPAKAPQS
jgi:seryl-tRNA synthetase